MSHATLGAAISHHFMLRTRVYGHMLTIPKCHYALHLPGLLKEFGYLISTFMHERKHRVLKAFANNRHYVGKQERGLLQDCTCRELQRLQNNTSSKDGGKTRWQIHQQIQTNSPTKFARRSWRRKSSTPTGGLQRQPMQILQFNAILNLKVAARGTIGGKLFA